MRATPSSSRRQIRRNRITERDAVVVAIVAAASALAGAFADVRPTSWRVADVVLAAVLTGFVAWAGASAPWWVLAGAAAIAVIVAPAPLWVALAGAGFVVATVIGARRASVPAGRAVSAGLTINALLRWEGTDHFAVSAIVTGSIALVIVVSGVARRHRSTRRAVTRGLIVVAVVAAIAVIGAAIAAAQASGDLRDGERALRAAASALRAGDIAEASQQLEISSQHLADASRALERPWARPVLAVPIVGQHVEALSELSTGAEALTRQAATSVSQIDVDSLRVIAGVIDVPAIEVLETPFSETNTALRDLAAIARDARSPWLVGALGDRIDELVVELDALIDETDHAVEAVRLAPSLLGADGPRTYFVAFTTPAEARGLGGYMGSWAELRAEEGRLTVTRSGTTTDLTSAMSASPPVLDGPPDYVRRYGRFGAGLDGAPVAVDFWSNYTMAPDFPSVTEVIAQLYPASGGSEIDGAIALDVDAVARFLELTDPIEVQGPAGPIELTPTNARDLLLRGQYEEIDDDVQRDAVLAQFTAELLEAVFGRTLPGPRMLAETIGPSMADGGIVVWSRHPGDQQLLRDLGVSGELPAPRADGLAVVSTNAGANKLDTYLQRQIAYEAVVDEPTGALRATVTVVLGNDAPPDLPSDVGGNPFDLPAGTNRQYLSVYSPWRFTGAAIDGRAQGMEAEEELGWNVYSTYVDIPPGADVEVRLELAGTLPDDAPYDLTLRSQATVVADEVRIDVTTTDGRTLLSSHQPQRGVARLPDDGE